MTDETTLAIYGPGYTLAEARATADRDEWLAALTDYYNWGEVIRRSSADKYLRVANLSTVYTAHVVTLTVADTGSAASPSQAAMHLLSADGLVFRASLEIGDLPPGTTSEILTLRRVVPSDADLGAWTYRIMATPVVWSTSLIPADDTGE